ncbi:MAG: phage integrase N-terminal SAM-like domain-containing protein [Byssovorax sp.]
MNGDPLDPKPQRLLDRVRETMRVRHLSPRTEEAYLGWIRRFIRHHGLRHPRDLGPDAIVRFLGHLATEQHVAASTQNQALAAILFLYVRVLGIPVEALGDFARAKRPERLPAVLTHREVAAVLDCMAGAPLLMASLLYGAGLRLLECARLRVKDLDFDRQEILVREGKGDKDRMTTRAGSSFRTRWRGSCRVLAVSGRGSGCFRRLERTGIRRAGRCGGTICTRACFSARSTRPA